VLLAHAGNRIDAEDRTEPRFPSARVGRVTTVIARALGDLRPSSVVSAAANGADLIVLAEAQRLAIATHVVLPLPAEAFLEASVAGSDPSWVELFCQVLDTAGTSPGSTIETLDLAAESTWYLVANGLILERARAVARPDEAIVAMTVRPTEGETPPSATDDFARLAEDAGLTVLTLDPRPGRTGALRIS
jgi:prophage DNA circulation protein